MFLIFICHLWIAIMQKRDTRKTNNFPNAFLLNSNYCEISIMQNRCIWKYACMNIRWAGGMFECTDLCFCRKNVVCVHVRLCYRVCLRHTLLRLIWLALNLYWFPFPAHSCISRALAMQQPQPAVQHTHTPCNTTSFPINKLTWQSYSHYTLITVILCWSKTLM